MKTKPLIILDPGHGGWNSIQKKYMTAGKRSLHPVDGEMFYEGVNNRLVARDWAKILRKNGYPVDFTVLPSDFRDTPLSQRVRFEKEMYRRYKGNCLFISIHSNGHKNPDAHGHEVFTSPGITKSDFLADAWHNELDLILPDHKKRTDYRDGFADKEAYFHVLTKTLSPAILIELAFHTNDDDVRLMRQPDFNSLTGRSLVKAIKKYLNNPEKDKY